MGKYYLGTGNQQINFQVVDSTGVISDLNLSGLYLSVTGKATDADKLDNYDSSFFRNAQNLTGIYTGQISGSIGNADTLDGLDSSYFLNGANITGTVSLSGTFTGYYTGAFSGTITHTDYIRFHTGLGINPDPAELTWDDNVGTMQLGLDANVDLRVGFQNYEFVANRNASTLSKGSVVYISGAQGNRPAVALALANADSTSAVTFGILAEDIPSMADGYAITNGLLTNLNTTGFAEGAALYLSPTVSGAIISSKPQAPNHGVLVGFCVRSHQSAGEILVKIQNGPELDELHDVRIISAQNNDIIRYNAPSGVWFNSNTLALNGTGSHYISGDLGIGTSAPTARLHIVGADKRQIISSTTDNAALVLGQWDGATNRIESSTRKLLITSYASGISLGVNGSENVHVSTSGNLGVGTTSPQFKLDVNGASVFRDTINVGPNIGTISWGSMGGGSGFGIRAESGRGFSLGSNGNWDYIVINTSGNVGIGTTSPTQKFYVSGGNAAIEYVTGSVTYTPSALNTSPRLTLIGQYSTTDTYNFIRYWSGGNHDWSVGTVTQSSGAADYIFQSYNGSAHGERVRITAAGNVGIGAASPSYKLEVNGSLFATTINVGNGTSTGNAIMGVNGSTNVSNIYLARSDTSWGINNETDLRFYYASGRTTSPGSGTVAMVITNSGNVGIGTTSPLTILNLSGGGGAVYQTFTDTTNAYHHGYVGKNGGGLVFGFSSQNGSFSADEKMRVTTSGNVGIATTSPSYKLHVNGNSFFEDILNIAVDKRIQTYPSSVGGYAMGLTLWSANTSGASEAYGRPGFIGRNLSWNGSNFIAASSNAGSNWGVVTGMMVTNTDVRFLTRAASENGLDYSLGTDLTSITRMVINTSGNVGIGTTTPSYKLHVVGDARIGANGQRIWLYDDGNAHVHATSGPLWLNSDDASGIYINNQNNGNVILTNGTGRVGIGTTTPGYKLHIGDNSATASAHMMLDGVFGNTTAASHARIYFSDTNFGIGAGGWASSGSDDDLYLWAYDGSGRDIRFAKTSDGTSAVNTANWTTNMIIKNDGSVGIGATVPDQKLDVRGYIVSNANNLASEGGFYLGNNGHGIRRAATTNDVYVYTTSGSLYLGASGTNTQHVTINSSGNVIATGNITSSTSTNATQTIQVTNSNAANSALSRLVVSNGTYEGSITVYGTGFTTNNAAHQNRMTIAAPFICHNVSGQHYWWIGTTGAGHDPTNANQVMILTTGGQFITMPPSYSYSAWGLDGINTSFRARTVTDSSTAASGTAASAVMHSFGASALAATNTSVTTTNAATVYIAGGPSAGTNQTITNSWGLWNAGKTRLDGDVTIGGNLTVNGTTTTVNSTVTTIDDPIITLGGDTAPTVDDNKDRGVEFRWHNGSAAKVGFFGFDDSTGYFTFIPDATNTSEVFSGTQGDIQAANFRGTFVGSISNALTAGSYLTGSPTSSYNGSVATTFNVDATSANTANKVVARDGNGDFSARIITATTFSGALSGNSSTTTKLNVTDSRNTADTPETISMGIVADFKTNTTNSLSDGGTYNGVLTFRQYGSGTDWSGGRSHQLAFTDNDNIWHRSGTSTSWGTWYKIWHQNNDGAGSGLDADLLDGYNQDTANTANTVVRRDASGNFSAGTITATTLSGNATTATSLASTKTGTITATATNTYYPAFSSSSEASAFIKVWTSSWLGHNQIWGILTVQNAPDGTTKYRFDILQNSVRDQYLPIYISIRGRNNNAYNNGSEFDISIDNLQSQPSQVVSWEINPLYGTWASISSANAGFTTSNILFSSTTRNQFGAKNLIINTSGNVGIGTDPSEKLHVSGGNAYIAYSADTTAYNAGAFNTSPRLTLLSGSAASRYNLIRYTAGGSHEWAVGTVHNAAGTADYIFQSYNGSAYGERVRIDASGNVGINNTAPSTKLSIGTKVVDDYNYSYDTNALYVVHPTSTSTTVLNDPKEVLLLARQGTGGQAYGAAASFRLSRYENSSVNARTRLDLVLAHDNFLSSPTTAMTIRSDGNIGIGTTTPTYKLQVQGTAYVDSTLFVNGAATIEDTLTVKTQNGSHNVAIIDYSGVAGGRIKVLVDGVVRSQIGTYSADNTFFNVGYGGSVGICTSSPQTPLHAYASTTDTNAGRTTVLNVLTLESENTAAQEFNGFGQGLVFRGSTYNNATQRTLGRIVHKINDDSVSTTRGTSIHFETSDNATNTNAPTEKMVINYAGNVGIGITNPYSSLSVKAQAVSWGEGILVDPASNGFSAIYFRTEANQNSSVTGTWALGKNSSAQTGGEILHVVKNGLTGGALHRVDAAQSWKTTGETCFGFNVGIGTTTPTAAKLQISSGGISTQDSTRTFASTTFNSAIGSSDTRTLAFNGTGGSSVWWCDSGTPSFAIDSAGGTTGFWRYSSGWVQRMALDANGFGVNTTSPGVKLTTRSGANSLPATSGTAQNGAGLRVEGGDNAVIDIGTNSVDTWIQATDKSGLENYYRLLLNPRGGNVGIGLTTNPAYKLEVNGSFAATTKSFVIKHPTKEGKKLRYGSLEGPENGVYVRGKTTSKVIELPDYWTKLVDPESITVQLTPIGSHQKLYVEKIEDNKVYIANENLLAKSINCFFYILAERADVEKLQVEIDA